MTPRTFSKDGFLHALRRDHSEADSKRAMLKELDKKYAELKVGSNPDGPESSSTP